MFAYIIKALGLVKDFSDAKVCYGKRWFTSKTLWVNAIALAAALAQYYYGIVLPVEAQAGLLAVINMLLRLQTDQPVVAKESDIVCADVKDQVDKTTEQK